MIYVNKRTGATIDSPCLLSGEDWELISEAAEAEEVATVEEMETVEEADAKEEVEAAEAEETETAEAEEVEAAEAEAIEAEEIPEEADAKKTEKTNKVTPKKRNNKKGE